MEPQSSPASLAQEIAGIVEQLKLPGLTAAAVVEARRKDIEALAEANRITLAGAQDLMARQREMLQRAVQELRGVILNGTDAGGAATTPFQLGELVQKTLRETLGGMRDLAELTRKSQSDAFGVISERMQRNVEELRAMLLPRSS
jgi:phasin family protein